MKKILAGIALLLLAGCGSGSTGVSNYSEGWGYNYEIIIDTNLTTINKEFDKMVEGELDADPRKIHYVMGVSDSKFYIVGWDDDVNRYIERGQFISLQPVKM